MDVQHARRAESRKHGAGEAGRFLFGKKRPEPGGDEHVGRRGDLRLGPGRLGLEAHDERLVPGGIVDDELVHRETGAGVGLVCVFSYGDFWGWGLGGFGRVQVRILMMGMVCLGSNVDTGWIERRAPFLILLAIP